RRMPQERWRSGGRRLEKENEGRQKGMIGPVRDRRFREGRPDRVGVGLRSAHHGEFLRTLPAVPWLEAVTENYLGRDAGGGRAGEILARLREHYPVALHGVSLSIGSVDPLDFHYLKQVR